MIMWINKGQYRHQLSQDNVYIHKFFSINTKAASFNDKAVLEIINLWKKKRKKKEGKVRAAINFTPKKLVQIKVLKSQLLPLKQHDKLMFKLLLWLMT